MITRALITYAVLALSVAANGWFAIDKLGESGRHKAACELAAAKAQAEAYGARAGMLEWLVQQGARDTEATFARLDAVADKAEARNTKWRDRPLPEPTCGPGQPRLDATNEMLGHGHE